jgi:hypothetical protein
MSVFNKCSFEGTTIILDGNEYNDCTFKKCRVIVTRGNFSLRRSTFDGCVFDFGGEAENIRNLVIGLLGQGPGNPSIGNSAKAKGGL